MGRTCNPYWPTMFAAAFRVVQLAWDARTTCRGIGEWETTKPNAYRIHFDKLFVLCLSSPHTNVLEPQLCSLKNFLNTVTTHHTVHNTNTVITDQANSTYCSTKHSHTRTHTIWSNENDPKSRSEQTYISPIRDVNSRASFSHTQSLTQTTTHTYYYDSPLLNLSAH